ncbi:hypothetical protein, partial [Streptomyces rochei]|uniref:hypothetical protein n=1 Tax=Streptomyces rochei TaxID=1928 RepID=UPI001AD7FFE1
AHPGDRLALHRAILDAHRRRGARADDYLCRLSMRASPSVMTGGKVGHGPLLAVAVPGHFAGAC